ncbi:hypothetical protein M427DRAFT_47154 [Gonapodya prolifera JEL478]|uniref:Uncharacterized protein n=1 Tax=Gonapodya prolifera (strain JEL478) TaxID=1344416 RepID=A0A139A3S1_GONPJ|nr:hypothetical protein M427DRAFT_47154 [Gonapodya prolifera JEL478]|eukprot:KXS11431.1 hypothetical protein M427DRAFT_47154 [Gonapodya prolifera JEL478]
MGEISASIVPPDVRPEALTWLWNNVDLSILKSCRNSAVRSLAWVKPPNGPAHSRETVVVKYLDPLVARGLVVQDNFLVTTARPRSFAAASVVTNNHEPLNVIVQYLLTGSAAPDIALDITLRGPNKDHCITFGDIITTSFRVLSSLIMEQYKSRVIAVLETRAGRGRSRPCPVKLPMEKLWNPTDHVSLIFSKTSSRYVPGIPYLVNTHQDIAEYIGSSLSSPSIHTSRPRLEPLPTRGGYWYATLVPTPLKSKVPNNHIVRAWDQVPEGAGSSCTVRSISGQKDLLQRAGSRAP